MVYSAQLSSSKRATLLGGIVTAHLVLLALVLTAHGTPPAQAYRVGPLTVESLPNDVDQSKPIHAAVTTKPLFKLDIAPFAPARVAAQRSDPAGSYGDCAILDQLGKAINADPASEAAIDKIPDAARSLSDAIVIWNAGWTEVTSATDAPLAAVRALIIGSLKRVDSRCLDQQVIGPRMIAVPLEGQTRLLVIGSGYWEWRQVLDPAVSTTIPISESLSVPAMQPTTGQKT